MGRWERKLTAPCIQPYSSVRMIYMCKELHLFTKLLDSNYKDSYNLYPKCMLLHKQYDSILLSTVYSNLDYITCHGLSSVLWVA